MIKIAVIEDEVIVRETIIERLTDAGYHVLSAENGLRGIELIREQRPDLVLCDIMMPNLGGFGVLEYVRKDPATSLIPFIFLSALSDKTDLRKGMLSGADDYLTKPFTREELLNAVAVRLRKRESYEKSLRAALDEFRDSLNRSLPHEFFTPLNSILGLSNLLRDTWRSIPEEETDEMLSKIGQSGQRLLRLVQNYLRFADLESVRHDEEQRARLLLETCSSPDGVIAETANYVASRAKRTKDVIVHADEAVLCIEESNLGKMVEELVDNACKFSLDGTRIEVTGRNIDGYYELTVMDRGRGMSSKHVQSIGAYQQFDRTEFEQRGIGLGLAIVHAIADLHRGTVHIDSEQGRYTAVSVLMPTAEVEEEERGGDGERGEASPR